MAVDIYAFDVTAATGTTKTSPQITAITMPPRIVRKIEVTVPDGPRGEVGMGFGQANRRVYPYGSGDWIRPNNETVELELDNAVDTGAWQVFLYNTGTYTHTFNIRVHCDLIASRDSSTAPVTTTTLDVTSITPDTTTQSGDTSQPPPVNEPPPVVEVTPPADASPTPESVQWVP